MKKVVINLGLVSSLVFGVALAHAANEGSENMPKRNTTQVNYYKTYEGMRNSQVPVDSAKDVQVPGKILMQKRLNVTDRDSEKGLDSIGTAGRGI